MEQRTYSTLTEFLVNHNAKDNASIKSTHNRIKGGSYVIEEHDREAFYALYTKHVFTDKKLEFLTERQIEDGTAANNGPLLVDLDFRYDYAVTERQHDKQFLEDIVNSLYLEELCKFLVFSDASPEFNVFIMEKPHVNRVADKQITKDGVHIVFGIQMDHTLQMMLRERVVSRFPDYSELPLTNSAEDVFDSGISQGGTGWQLFGSRKPGNEAYELTQHFVITYDKSDGEFMMDEMKASDFDFKNNFIKLSVQNDQGPSFKVNSKI